MIRNPESDGGSVGARRNDGDRPWTVLFRQLLRQPLQNHSEPPKRPPVKDKPGKRLGKITVLERVNPFDRVPVLRAADQSVDRLRGQQDHASRTPQNLNRPLRHRDGIGTGTETKLFRHAHSYSSSFC